MVRCRFSLIFIRFVSLGKITWNEYVAVYIKFHHLNATQNFSIDGYDFLNQPLDNDRKSMKTKSSFVELSEIV